MPELLKIFGTDIFFHNGRFIKVSYKFAAINTEELRAHQHYHSVMFSGLNYVLRKMNLWQLASFKRKAACEHGRVHAHVRGMAEEMREGKRNFKKQTISFLAQ